VREYSKKNWCGRFQQDQIKNPHGNSKDKIISSYQRTQEKKFRYNFQKLSMVAMLTGFMWMTACGSRKQVCRGFAYIPEKSDSIENQDEYNENEKVGEESPGNSSSNNAPFND
jgi:hypothetical protein